MNVMQPHSGNKQLGLCNLTVLQRRLHSAIPALAALHVVCLRCVHSRSLAARVRLQGRPNPSNLTVPTCMLFATCKSRGFHVRLIIIGLNGSMTPERPHYPPAATPSPPSGGFSRAMAPQVKGSLPPEHQLTQNRLDFVFQARLCYWFPPRGEQLACLACWYADLHAHFAPIIWN